MPVIEQDWVSSLTAKKCEYAWGLAIKMQTVQNDGWAAIGLRAAKAKDPKLLVALEKMAEHTQKLDETQRGETRRQASRNFSEQRETTTTQMCKEAYRLADEGNAIEHLKWVYGAAAWLCGYNL